MKRNKKDLKQGADMGSEDDAFGSYTGICVDNEQEIPVQDADDL